MSFPLLVFLYDIGFGSVLFFTSFFKYRIFYYLRFDSFTQMIPLATVSYY